MQNTVFSIETEVLPQLKSIFPPNSLQLLLCLLCVAFLILEFSIKLKTAAKRAQDQKKGKLKSENFCMNVLKPLLNQVRLMDGYFKGSYVVIPVIRNIQNSFFSLAQTCFF